MENSLEKINREMGAEIRGKYGTKKVTILFAQWQKAVIIANIHCGEKIKL
jgi:hypothetical protein